MRVKKRPALGEEFSRVGPMQDGNIMAGWGKENDKQIYFEQQNQNQHLRNINDFSPFQSRFGRRILPGLRWKDGANV